MPNQFLTEPQIMSNNASVSGNFTVGGVLSASRICSLNYTGNVVRSVAGKTGDVTLTLSDVPGAPTPSGSAPSSLGIASPGALSTYSRSDHVHPANLTSSPSLDDNSRSIASTEFVKQQAHTGNMCNSTLSGDSGVSSYASLGNYRFALGTHSHPSDPTKINVSGGTFTGGITGTTSSFAYVSAAQVQGDGSLLRNVCGTDLTKMPLIGGTFTGGITGTTATFNYISGERVEGDGSLLRNVCGTDSTKMPLIGGTFTGNITGVCASFSTISGGILLGDGSQLCNVLGPAAIAQLATYDVSNCASAAQQIGHNLGSKNPESLVVGYRSCSIGACSLTLGNSAIGNLEATTVGIAACSGPDSVSVGYRARTKLNAVSVGAVTTACEGAIAIGTCVTARSCDSNPLGSVAIGCRTTASDGSVSIGEQACSGLAGVAIGLRSCGSGCGVAIGCQTNACVRGVAVGTCATAVGEGVAIGTVASGNNFGVAVGNLASTCLAGVAVGYNAYSESCGVAVGHESCAQGLSSVSIGYCSTSYLGDVVIGSCALGAMSSVAVGESACACHAAISIGYDSHASTHAIAIGSLACALYDGSIAIGDGVKATQTDQVLVGCGVTSNSTKTTIIGYKASGTGEGATSIGYCTSSGKESASLGSRSVAYDNSVSIGNSAQSSNCSIAIGFCAKSIDCSISIGTNTCSSGTSLAMGLCINASESSMSIGQGVSTQSSSTAIGKNSTAKDFSTSFAQDSYAQKCSSAYGFNSLACTGSTTIGCGAWARCFGTVLGSNSGATTWGSISIGPDAKIRGFCVADVCTSKNKDVNGLEICSIPRIPSCCDAQLSITRTRSIELDYCNFIHHAAVAKVTNGSEIVCDIGLGYNINPTLFAVNTNVYGFGIPADTCIKDVYRDTPALGSPCASPGADNRNKAFHCDGRYRIVLSKTATLNCENVLLRFTHPFICYSDAAINAGSNILTICSTNEEPGIGKFFKSHEFSSGSFGCMSCSVNLRPGFAGGLSDGYAPHTNNTTGLAAGVSTFARNPWRITSDNNGNAYIFEDDSAGDDSYGSLRKVNLNTGVTTTLITKARNETASQYIARRYKDRYSVTSDGSFIFIADKQEHIIFKINLTNWQLSGFPRTASTVNQGISGVAGYRGEIGVPYIFSGLTTLTSAQYYAPSKIIYTTDNATTPKRYLTFANTERFPLALTNAISGSTVTNTIPVSANLEKIPLDGDFGPAYGFIIWDVEITSDGLGVGVTPRASLSKVVVRNDIPFTNNKTITEIVNLTRDPVGNIFVAVRASANSNETYDTKNLVHEGTFLSDLIIKIPKDSNAFLKANTFGLAKSSYAVSANTLIHSTAYPTLRYPQHLTISPHTGELIIVDSTFHGDNLLDTAEKTSSASVLDTENKGTTNVYKVSQHGYKRLITPNRPTTMPANVYGGSLTAVPVAVGTLETEDHRYGYGVAVDSKENIFISCYLNNTIQCLSAINFDPLQTGNHTYVQRSVAGGKGNKGQTNDPMNSDSIVPGGAAFFCPRGLAVDSQRNWLYVADFRCIKKVFIGDNIPGQPPFGTTQIVAGQSDSTDFLDGTGRAARLSNPTGLALSKDGRYLYVTDTFNKRIRRIDTTTNEVITVAGTGDSGLTPNTMLGPRGLALRDLSTPTNHLVELYFTDITMSKYDTSVLRAGYALTTNAQTAGTKTAPLITQQGNPVSYLRKIIVNSNTRGTPQNSSQEVAEIITLVGGLSTSPGAQTYGLFYPPNPRFNLPGQRPGLYDANGVAVDNNGNVYVSETSNSTIRKISPDGLVLDYLGYSMATTNRAASATGYVTVNSAPYLSAGAAHTITAYGNNRHPYNLDWYETFSGRMTGVNPNSFNLKLQDIIAGNPENIFYHNITDLTFGTSNNAAANQVYVLTSSPSFENASVFVTNATSYSEWGSSPAFWGWASQAPSDNSEGRYRNCVRMIENNATYFAATDGICRTLVGGINYGKILDSKYGMYGSISNCLGLVGLYKATLDFTGMTGLFLLDVSRDDKVGVLRRIDRPIQSSNRVYGLTTAYGNPYANPDSSPINSSIANLQPVAIIDNLVPKLQYGAPKYPIRDFVTVNNGVLTTQIYFSDTKNDVIRRYNTGSQTIETYAGVAGVPDEDHPYYPFINPLTLRYSRSYPNLHTFDIAVSGITGTAGVNNPFDFTSEGGTRQFAGGLIPFFNRPRGLTLTSNQNTLFVADSQNHAVKRINLANNTLSQVSIGGLSAIQPAVSAANLPSLANIWNYVDRINLTPVVTNRVLTPLELESIRNSETSVTKSLRLASNLSYVSSTVKTPGYLTRTNTSITQTINNWTWSGWCKRGITGNTIRSGLAYIGGSSSGGANKFFAVEFLNNSIKVSFSATEFLVTQATYSNSSTWYHIVVSVDTAQTIASNRVRLYVNGVLVTSFTSAVYPSLNLRIPTSHYTVGASMSPSEVSTLINTITTPSQSVTFDGYLADINFVDKQTLPASVFGSHDFKTDAILQRSVIWSLKNHDLISNFGGSGDLDYSYCLRFSDSTDANTLCYNSYPDNFNFTPNNLNFQTLPQISTNFIEITANVWDEKINFGAFSNLTIPTQDINPRTSNSVGCYRFNIAKAPTATTTTSRIIYFNKPIVASQKIEILCFASTGTLNKDPLLRAGTSTFNLTTPISSGQVTNGVFLRPILLKESNGTTNTTTLNSITFLNQDVTFNRDVWFGGVLIDGNILYSTPVFHFLRSFVNDTPTNNPPTIDPVNYSGNFAIINPASGGADAATVVTNSNLTVRYTGTTTTTRSGSLPMSSGYWYWEVLVEDGSAGITVGITQSPLIADDFANGIHYGSVGGLKYVNQAAKDGTAYGPHYGSGDVIGVLLNFTTRDVTFFKNGISAGLLSGVMKVNTTYWPIVRGNGATGKPAIVHCNFGQLPFLYNSPYQNLSLAKSDISMYSIRYPVDWTYTQSAVETTVFADNPTPVTTQVILGSKIDNADARLPFNPNLYTVLPVIPYETTPSSVPKSVLGIGNLNHNISNFGFLNNPTRLTLNTNVSATSPWGAIALDSILYIADTDNGAIKKAFNPTGAMGTVRLSSVAPSGGFFTSQPLVDVSTDNTGRIYYAQKDFTHYPITRMNGLETSVENLTPSNASTDFQEVYALQSDPVGARVFVSASKNDERFNKELSNEITQLPTNIWSINTGDLTRFDLYKPKGEDGITTSNALAYDLELDKATNSRNLSLLIYSPSESTILSRNNLTYARIKTEPGYSMKVGMLVEGFVTSNIGTNLFAPNTYVTSILDQTRIALSKPFPGTTSYTSTGAARLSARFQEVGYRIALPIVLTAGSDIMLISLSGGTSGVFTPITPLRVGDYLADILKPQYHKVLKVNNEDKDLSKTFNDLTEEEKSVATYEGLDWPSSEIIDYFGEFKSEAVTEGNGKTHPVVITEVLPVIQSTVPLATAVNWSTGVVSTSAVNVLRYRLSRIPIKSSPGYVTGFFTPGAGISVGLNATTTLNTGFALGSNSNPLPLEPGGTALPTTPANYLRVTLNGRDYMMPLYNLP